MFDNKPDISYRTRTMNEGDYIRAAITRARIEGMTMDDLEDAADHAATSKAFSTAVALKAGAR